MLGQSLIQSSTGCINRIIKPNKAKWHFPEFSLGGVAGHKHEWPKSATISKAFLLHIVIYLKRGITDMELGKHIIWLDL
jgi:hypothetical protein